jgi:hypothetical protein
MASLSVLAPFAVDDLMLSSSTAPENDYPAWASTTAYAVGDYCISTTTHRVYQCMVANTGKDPTDLKNQDGTTTVYWLDFGPTNRWAMFDNEVNTQTIVPSPLTVVLEVGSFTAFYLAGLDASQIDVSIKDAPGGNVIYSYSGQLEGSQPADYDEYFFDRFKPQTDFIASGIEQYTSGELTITLSSPSGNVKCGVLAVGDLRALGQTQYGAKAKPKTYSYIKTDDFGRTAIKRRKAAKDMTATAFLDLSEANTVTDLIQGLLDVPAVWVGSDLPEYGFLRVFGLGSGEISADGPTYCQLSLSVQGMI